METTHEQHPLPSGMTRPGPGGHDRLCSCPPNHINCLTAKQWIQDQLGVWQFYYEARDVRDKTLHPATFQ